MTALAAIARRDFVLRRSYRLAFGADLVFVVVDLLLYYFISDVVGPVPAADLGGAPELLRVRRQRHRHVARCDVGHRGRHESHS